MLHELPKTAENEPPRLSNVLIHEILTTLRAIPQHAKAGAASQQFAADAANIAHILQQILHSRLASDARKGNAAGNPKASGRQPTLYYGECEQRGNHWLLGAKQVTEFMRYGSIHSCSVRLAQCKRPWLDRTIMLDGRETVVAVRRATADECAAYAAAQP